MSKSFSFRVQQNNYNYFLQELTSRKSILLREVRFCLPVIYPCLTTLLPLAGATRTGKPSRMQKTALGNPKTVSLIAILISRLQLQLLCPSNKCLGNLQHVVVVCPHPFWMPLYAHM